MPNSKPVVVAGCVIAGVLVCGLLIYYFQETKPDSNRIVSQVFDNGTSKEVDTERPILKSDADGLADIDTIKPIQGKVEDKKKKESESTIKYSDSQLSKLWFDARNEELSLDQRKQAWDELLAGIPQLLEAGQTLSIVESFPAVLTDKDKYGFFESFYTYPNGTLDVLTVVGPPGVVSDSSRTVTFTTIEVSGKRHVDVFKDLNMVPVDFAVVSGSDNYLLVSGAELNDKLYSLQETPVLLGFHITASKVSLTPFADGIKLQDTDVEIVNDVLRFKNFKLAPDRFTNSEGDDQIATTIYVVTGEEETHEYEMKVINGKITLTAYRRTL